MMGLFTSVSSPHLQYLPFFLLLLLLSLGISSAFFIGPNPYGSVPEDNPILEAKVPFTLTCTINTTTGKTANDVYFTLDDDRVNQSYIYVANNSIAQLRHPGLKFKYDSKWICCWLEDVSRDIGCWIVEVGFRPFKPEIVEDSVVVLNWNTLQFSWINKENKHYRTDHVAQWKTSEDEVWQKCERCPHEKQCCQGKGHFLDESKEVMMRVEATNTLGKTMSEVLTKQVKDIVTTRAIQNLEPPDVSSPSHIDVTWKSPAPGKPLHHQMFYQCEYDEAPKVQNLSSPAEHLVVRVVNHAPNQNCTLTVRTRPKAEGKWSQNTTKQFTMPQTAPSSAPKVTDGAFTMSEDPMTGRRDISIYWQPLEERHKNGKNLRYTIMAKEVESGRVVPGQQVAPPQLRGLSSLFTYEVSIIAVNNVGHSSPSNVIKITEESKLPKPPKNITAIATSEKEVTLSWQPKDLATGYTAYWCKVHAMTRQCLDTTSLRWRSVSMYETSVELNLTDCSIEHCIFGLSVEMLQGSSGIEWIYTHDSRKKADSPEFGRVTTTPDLIYLQLHRPSSSRLQGYVYAYKILWCPLEDKNQPCSDSEKSAVIEPLEEYTLTGMEYLQIYQVKVWSLTQAGPSLTPSISVVKTKKPVVTPDDLKYYIPIGVVAAILFITGIATLIRYCCQCYKKAKEKSAIKIDDLEHQKLPPCEMTVFRDVSGGQFISDYTSVGSVDAAALELADDGQDSGSSELWESKKLLGNHPEACRQFPGVPNSSTGTFQKGTAPHVPHQTCQHATGNIQRKLAMTASWLKDSDDLEKSSGKSGGSLDEVKLGNSEADSRSNNVPQVIFEPTADETTVDTTLTYDLDEISEDNVPNLVIDDEFMPNEEMSETDDQGSSGGYGVFGYKATSCDGLNNDGYDNVHSHLLAPGGGTDDHHNDQSFDEEENISCLPMPNNCPKNANMPEDHNGSVPHINENIDMNLKDYEQRDSGFAGQEEDKADSGCSLSTMGNSSDPAIQQNSEEDSGCDLQNPPGGMTLADLLVKTPNSGLTKDVRNGVRHDSGCEADDNTHNHTCSVNIEEELASEID